MSLTTALNSAMSGLTAAGRASEIVAENIANAMTPGYARRSLSLASSNGTAPGVRILGVERHADPGLIANRRVAVARFGAARSLAAFQSRFEALVGNPTDSTSIGNRLAEFDSSLISASSRPESSQRLNAAVMKASDLAQSLTQASEGIRTMRSQADRSIGSQVAGLNQALSEVQRLNSRITAARSSGSGTAALLDQRQLLVDRINTIVPVNEVSREYGQIALYTDGGAILLDGQAAKLGFASVNDTVPEMSIENGALSGLTINGISVRTDSKSGAIRGGTLSAGFQIRDELAVSAQSDLDAVARDLIARFETAGLDPTRPAGSPGLFTDEGAAFDPQANIGLAGRLTVNSAVDPAQGGEVWRLRAGLGATDPGRPGEARLLQALSGVLAANRPPVSDNFGTGKVTAAGIAANLLSRVAQNSGFAEKSLSFASASRTELTQIELAQGVDTDAELQTLMIIEQAFAANARIITVVDDMMKTILRL
jgi:flagellar hook-associated protein 1